MKFNIVIFIGIIYSANCILYSINVTKGPSEKDWKLFKEEFNKTYESKQEEQKRHKIFRHNWINIQKHNKRYEKGQETYSQGVNRFADFTVEEFAEFYGVRESENKTKYTQVVTMNQTKSDTEDSWDWRNLGAITPAKDQGSCGACYAFCAVGLLESYHYRKTGELLNLSEQHIIDCYSNSSCSGGVTPFALLFVENNGIHLSTNYPYQAKQNKCRNITEPPLRIAFKDIYVVNNTDDNLKQAIKEYGPLATYMYTSSKWMFYKSGVWYDNECSEEVNHCLLLVGYGTENGNDYWLLKNSWGSKWGQDGFIKVARNRHENYCGMQFGLSLE